MEEAAEFHHIKVENFPFLYLGHPVGANPRRALTLF
jgi:hypothetical protein